MSRFLLGISFLLVMVLSAPAVAAQSGADLEQATEAVLAADPDELAAALEAEITDNDLPAGFFAPEDGVPENAEIIDLFASSFTNIGAGMTSVIQGLNTDPQVIPGMMSAAVLTYLVVEDEITPADLEDFAAGVGEGLEDESDPNATSSAVEFVELYDTDAILVTLEMENSGTFVTVQMMAIPVGNVMVVSTIVVAAAEPTEAADIAALTENLTVAGVEFLGKVAAGA